jgi:hypothetical protein
MSEKPISPLRQRMIEDMSVRNFVEKTRKQGGDLRSAVQGVIRGRAHHRGRPQAHGSNHRHHRRAPHLGLDNDAPPSLMMPGIIIPLIFLE